MQRQKAGVLHADLKACNDYAHGLESAHQIKCPALFILGRRDVLLDLFDPARLLVSDSR